MKRFPAAKAISFCTFAIMAALLSCRSITSPSQLKSSIEAEKKYEIWHSFAGPLEKFIQSQLDDFSLRMSQKYQRKIVFVGLNKGSPLEALDELLLSAKIGHTTFNTPPLGAFVYEMGATDILQAKTKKNKQPIHKPINEVRKLAGLEGFSSSDFSPYAWNFYCAAKPTLQSMPWSQSTAILWKNATLEAKYELPRIKNWEDFEALQKENLKGTSYASKPIVGMGWLAAHAIDQAAAIANKQIATNANGVDGFENAAFKFDRKFFIDIFTEKQKLTQSNIMTFQKDGSSGLEEDFITGSILYYTNGGNRLPLILNRMQQLNNEFKLDVELFPGFKNNPWNNSIAGGNSFWIMAGHDDSDYQIAGELTNFLYEIQAKWAAMTLYIPFSNSTYEQQIEIITQERKQSQEGSRARQIAELKLKIAHLTYESLNKNPPKEFSKGILLKGYSHFRTDFMDRIIRSMGKGLITPKNTIEIFETEGNRLLE